MLAGLGSPSSDVVSVALWDMALDGTELKDLSNGVADDVIDLRRTIHQNPELGLENPETQKTILEALSGLGLEVSTGEAITSVVADLDSGRPGPTVLLRADTDALPMTEDTDETFRSTVEGRAHACGHDGHTAMLLGAAKLLSEHRSELQGRVRFMFQPGEEGAGGAEVMIDEGVLNGVDRAFALHVTPNIPAGYVASRPGSLMASADSFQLTVTGAGGHASTPHFCVDPIPAACAIVPALQTMVTRDLDASRPKVLTVGQIHAGTTTNVIPEQATLGGTIRAVSEEDRATLIFGLERVATGVAEAHGCSCETRLSEGYPVTVNHADQMPFVEEQVERALGSDHYFELPTPVMGAEDFSYVLAKSPGAMAFLGVCPDDIADSLTAAPVHSNRMRLNEAALTDGVALHLAFALAGTGSLPS